MSKIMTVEFSPDVDYTFLRDLQLDKKYINFTTKQMVSDKLNILFDDNSFGSLFSDRYIKNKNISGMANFIAGTVHLIDRLKNHIYADEEKNFLIFSYVRKYAMDLMFNSRLNIIESDDNYKAYYINALDAVLDLHMKPICTALIVSGKPDMVQPIADLEIGSSKATILNTIEMPHDEIINNIISSIETSLS